MSETSSEKLTPMMQQYAEIKKEFSDCLLFFRLGDFYELFYDDAKIASKQLGLVLTKRASVPMCGIPWHASEMYITKLVKNGHRIAICEQTETPEEAKSKRGHKATIERKVVRIITRGTLLESSMLGEKSNNFLLAISDNKCQMSVAYADISTGSFFVEEIEESELPSVLSKVSPAEIICSDGLFSKQNLLETLERYKQIIHPIPESKFKNNSIDGLKKFFGISFVDSLGKLSSNSIIAVAAVVQYIRTVYVSQKVSLNFPKLLSVSDFMVLDSFTRKSLELEQTQCGEFKGSLLQTLDKTKTSQGGRLLRSWLRQPLTNLDRINKRLNCVSAFFERKELLENVRKILSDFPDLERSLSRTVMHKASPRDLKAIALAIKIAARLETYTGSLFFDISLTDKAALELANALDDAIVSDPPLLARDGGFVKKGFNKEIDEYMDLLDNGEYVIQKLQKQYASETGITTLKIKNNNILGYFIDVSANYSSKVPYNFIHRQTLSSSIRYTTEKLSEVANKIYSADANIKRKELEIFEEFISKTTSLYETIRKIAARVSFFDVVSSLAFLAIENNYVRPILTEEKEIEIFGGRHPVVEEMLNRSGAKFVENDYKTNSENLIAILTGPNMGGKSTFIRQNAIIIILAQIGSFVPAQKAVVGIVDKVFSRVGASDDISSGKSTFMVEMIETACILRQATERSFVVLDEIGRGTSTYDGLAIASAVVEEISENIKARTIFATHYHELTKLHEHSKNIKYLTVKIQEWKNKIIFLHKIEEGFVNKSYGINVAALAGFPEKVLKRASQVLKMCYTNIGVD